MIQKDIVITDGVNKLGVIYSQILLKFSKLIQQSHRTVNNISNLTTTVDIKDMYQHDKIFQGYVFKLVEKKVYTSQLTRKTKYIYIRYKIKWKEVFGIINGQEAFVRYFSKCLGNISQTDLLNMVVVNAISKHFKMKMLAKFCTTVLSKFKVNNNNNKIFVHAISVSDSIYSNVKNSSSLRYVGYINKHIYDRMKIKIGRVDKVATAKYPIVYLYKNIIGVHCVNIGFTDADSEDIDWIDNENKPKFCFYTDIKIKINDKPSCKDIQQSLKSKRKVCNKIMRELDNYLELFL